MNVQKSAWLKKHRLRMATHLRAMRKAKDCPSKLTRFTYTNGQVELVRLRKHRRSLNYRWEYRWIKNRAEA